VDEFGYLSVLISIVLGFALTEVLKGLSNLVLRRGQTVFYWPALAWAAFSLVADVQAWWAAFGLRDVTHWSFGLFAVVLLTAIMLYLFAALVLPDTGRDGPLDMKAGYYAHRRWLFGALIGVVAASLSKTVALEGRLPEPANLAFHAAIGLIALGAIFIRREIYHRVIAAAGVAGLAVYILALFSRLA
jgi:hypothetical protein